MAGILKVDKYQDFNGNDIMTSDGAGNITMPSGIISGQNYPAFQVNLNNNQTISDAVHTVIQFDIVDYDTGSYWDAVNYRWKPLISGNYLIFYGVKVQHQTTTNMTRNIVRFQKNGVRIDNRFSDLLTTSVQQISTHSELLITTMNGTTDYLDVTAYGDTSDATSPQVGAKSTFGAYRIGA